MKPNYFKVLNTGNNIYTIWLEFPLISMIIVSVDIILDVVIVN